MGNMVKIENLKELIIKIRDEKVLLDADVAVIYGVETRDINKAVTNNPDKFPAGYIIELTKDEKNELVENLHRFDKLKHSTVSRSMSVNRMDRRYTDPGPMPKPTTARVLPAC